MFVNHYLKFDFDVFCSIMLEQETPFDYSQEEDAYFNFMENIGFTNALVIIKSLLSEIKDGYKKHICRRIQCRSSRCMAM